MLEVELRTIQDSGWEVLGRLWLCVDVGFCATDRARDGKKKIHRILGVIIDDISIYK